MRFRIVKEFAMKIDSNTSIWATHVTLALIGCSRINKAVGGEFFVSYSRLFEVDISRSTEIRTLNSQCRWQLVIIDRNTLCGGIRQYI